jgi:RNAse (barnase) inhibitor barstar
VESIDLDGTTWTRADDFYSAYFAAVGAPEWHGRNLDALWDSLTGADINLRNPPFRIRITGSARMSVDAREIVGRFEALIHEAGRAGHAVQIEVLP